MGMVFSSALAEFDELDSLLTLFLLDELVLRVSALRLIRSVECLSFKESEFSTTFSFKSTASDMDVFARSISSPQEGEKDNQLTRTDSLSDKKFHLSLLASGNQRH
ncbi:hypothetical protein SADUNF_Sadunf16G0057000 [Salix dunnii]|uniref:Uncharacterized protein n=1 Tax=Salix dunnii TaxID=1413687 RepID=A0A835J850_9ROSI|nr:hypothetical protein SADUNF_Sadunf16G0057000 [Salix dunnii]